MGGPQGLEQALGAGGRCQGEIKLLSSGEGRERSLWRRLVMQTPHRGGQRMQIEDAPNPTMIEREFVTGLDNPREFPSGEGVRESEPHDLVLHMEWYARVERGHAAGRGEGPVIQEADETRVLQALQIPPQLVGGDTGRLALLGEGGLTLENGAQPIIAR
jgi:hypothetical protein